MTEQWLTCDVEDGMFSDERVIVFATVDDEQVSFFVPASAIEDNRVRVMVFEEAGRWWAVLPTAEREIVPVKREVLVAV